MTRPMDVSSHSTRTRDGRRLHVQTTGTGTPTVVFEAGMGVSGNMWGAIVPRIAERTTAVVYDRSGLGRSPATAGPRDLPTLAADLLDVLADLDGGPFVLVGHSWGGPIIRHAAATRPDGIAGLVLVDQTDEHCDLFFETGNRRQTALAPRILPLVARLGLLRRMTRRFADGMAEPWADAMRTMDGTPASVRAQLAELRTSIDDLGQLRDRPLVLPPVPISVISGTKDGFLERGRRPAVVAAHRATAAAAPMGRHVDADRSSHYVPFTEPDLVAAEILRVLDLAGA